MCLSTWPAHTRRSRLELFAMRPAPVRASAIGYGSSVGGGLVDYLITDDAMWPEAERKYCSEKLVFMPHASLPGSPREMSETEFTRKTMGLPDEGVVFANFNGHYKIDPETFGLWMRILKRVPGSVLWIMKGSDTSCANLKKEAEIRGVRADRLVFAQQVETSQHIARIRLADIALDGYNLEGGATTLDALWAGVPVVVTSGSPFGNRGRYKMLEVCGCPNSSPTPWAATSGWRWNSLPTLGGSRGSGPSWQATSSRRRCSTLHCSHGTSSELWR